MIDPAQIVFNPADPRPAAFAPTSRYFGLPILLREEADGTIHAYVSRRFVPAPERLAAVGSYVVTEKDRADTIAFAVFGDPTLFWRLCDGNRVLHPRELETTGRRLRVTLPDGIAGLTAL
jgi:hypothetical protein